MTTPPATGLAANRVTADLTDFRITLSTTTFASGRYVFVAEQKGQRPHALVIRGFEVQVETPVIQPSGAGQELIVALPAGTYELWCPVGNHRAQGMTVTITVA